MCLPISMEFFRQATIVVDNARTHALPASQTCHSEIPALCHYPVSSMRQKKNRPKSLPSRRSKRRSGSFPMPEKSRWESMSLMTANSMALSPPRRPLPRRCNSSDDIYFMEAPVLTIFDAGVDCLPRQPRREPSTRTMSLLDEALGVINSIELSVEQTC
jgi:hypothetical protein